MVFRRNIRTLALLAVCATCAIRPHRAQANGAFPAVSQLVGDPSDESHLVLRSNFGLLVSHDRGQIWDLICEAGVGYQNIEPPIAVLSDGTTIAALSNGIARGASECAFALATGVSAYVADVARMPGAPAQAVAVSVDIEGGVSQVWHSSDSGRSWERWGSALSELNAATLDVAGDEPGTLYVSGVSQASTVTGVLARSTDGGRTWTRSEVPGASKVSAPYIAAIAADDPNTLYVRLSGSPGHLLVTHDGGSHWAGVLDFEGPLDGFALSPDGEFALASGRGDGVWRARTSDLAFAQLSCAKLRCLSWTRAGLFACADEFQAGFLVGESADSGQTFEPRLHMSCVRGPVACGGESSVAKACDAVWPALSETLGRDCASAVFTPSDSCASGGASGADAGLGGRAGMGGNEQPAPPASGGCSFSALPITRRTWLLSLGVLVCAIGRRRAGKRSKSGLFRPA